MKLVLLPFLAAALTVYASAPEPLFDGSGRAVLRLPEPPAVPRAGLVEARREPTPVPPDLAAARTRVGNAAMVSRLPPRGAADAFSFGVIGDSEPGRFWWERVFNPGREAFLEQWRSLQAGPAEFVLQLGDFVSEGDVPHYREHVSLIEREAAKPFLRCVGNHDRSRPNGDADKNLYDAVFGARDYFFDHAGWRFVSVDSSDRRLTPSQVGWLKAALAVPGPKVVFTHVPPAFLRKLAPLPEVGELEAWSDDKGEAEAQKDYLRDFLTNYFDEGSEAFEDLVSGADVRAVYMGHVHAFWAADHRGVRYVISGGGGSPLYPLPPGYPKKRFAHVLSVRSGPSGLTETVVPHRGAPFVLPPVATPGSPRSRSTP